MITVSNASPLINLAWIGRLDLLQQLFDEVWIPEAVWQEIVVQGVGQPGAEEIQNAGWVQRRRIENLDLARSLQQDLDAGEAEAIVLAIETQTDLLLMDEKMGRETAAYFGIQVLGVLGILTRAKQLNMISKIKPFLDMLQTRAGFHIKPTLFQYVLQQNDEV